jgi:serine/threonine protein kinase
MRARPPRLPGYILGNRLGGGATCDVYSAADMQGRSAWAVKVLRDDAARDPANVQLLYREARVGTAVRHPNLVRVVRAGSQDCRPLHLVMERVAGQSLRCILNSKHWLDPRLACRIAEDVSSALAALHHADYVHGDVKPDNIHVGGDSKATLLDLGFAHHCDADGDSLCDGYVLGTANYVAPELCERPERDGTAADIFSLGVTLFELLTGDLPYPEGEVHETMVQHRDTKPESLWDWRGHWPLGLANLVDSMLSRDPDVRPTAADVERELQTMYPTTREHRRAA